MEEQNLGVAVRKDTILERLNKRNKDRQNYLGARLEQRNKENQEIEGADYFSQAFTERVKEIEQNINNILSDDSDLTRRFTAISCEIQELQKYLSNSTIFLPDYNIKACQNVLNELNAHSEEVRLKLIPKKKFGFNSKKVTAKSVSPKQAGGIDKVDFSEKSTISTSCFAWTLSNRQNEYILLIGSEVDRKDLTISNLNNCLIEIQGHPGSLQISNCENCTFLTGPISRSLFAENCKNSTFAAACQQLRLHSSFNCKLWIHVTCRAIIEDCTKIEIGNFNYEYCGIGIDFKKSGLDRTVNNYKDVADFNWLSPDITSPNWKLVNNANEIDWSKMREKFKENKRL